MIRTALQFASAATLDRYRPLMANFIVIRRCNLSCEYCTEFDDKRQGVEGETGLARAAQAGDDHQRVARQIDVDVLEIVGACAPNADHLRWHNRRGQGGIDFGHV